MKRHARYGCWRTVLLLLALVGVENVFAKDKNLFPTCSALEVAAQASAGQTVTVQTIHDNPTELILACLAFDVQPVGSVAETSCSVRHQTDFQFRLYLEASYTDPSTSTPTTMEYELKDVVGGSINRLHVMLPASGTYAVKFKNLASADTCVLKVRTMLQTENGEGVATQPVPALVRVTPTVLFSPSTSYTYFVFRHVRSALGSEGDRAILMESTRHCTDLGTDAEAESLVLAYVAPSDPSFVANTADLGDERTLSVRKYFFDRSGAFRMCYRLAAASTWSEVSLVSVFGGNPSYYTFESGQGPAGQIYVGQPITIHFHGYGLDTRPGGDQAKFVLESDPCSGPPAGGVDVATDLGPADDWGPNTRFTEWTWTLRRAGAYKVCYQRKDHLWEEVPSLDELGPGAVDHTAPPVGPVPTPTDPITHSDCPLAPSGAEPTKPYPTLLMVTLTTRTVPPSYLATLSRNLCVPLSAIAISRQSVDDSGNVLLWLSIQCDPASGSEKPPCNAQERKNYATFLASHNGPALQQLQWKSVEERSADDLFARTDTGIIGLLSQKKARFSLFVGCATLIIVSAMIVYAVTKHKENRHYFIQFGVDDDDVETRGADELEIDEHGGIAKKDPSSAHAVVNATIDLEMEDDH